MQKADNKTTNLQHH